MSQKQLDKGLLILLSLIYILLLVLPYSNVLDSSDIAHGEQEWKSGYIFDDLILAILYIPFLPFFMAHFFLRSGLLKDIMKFIVVGLSFFYIVISFYNVSTPIQDFAPTWGVFISSLPFPILLIYFIASRFAKKRSSV